MATDTLPDLTPAVMTGLAWYYLLAAALNAAAAAHVAYAEIVSEGASREGLIPMKRRFPRWLGVAYLGTIGLAALIFAIRGAFPAWLDGMVVAFFVATLANAILAIAAGADAAHFAEVNDAGHGVGQDVGPPSLDDHIPAVGLGRPINRTLWTLVWSVASVVFGAMGAVAILHGEFGLPTFFEEIADRLAGPVPFYLGATLLLVVMDRYRRTLANGLIAWGLLDAAILIFGLALADGDFRALVGTPAHATIVALIAASAGFAWISTRRIAIDDARAAIGLPPLEDRPTDHPRTWADFAYTDLAAAIGLTLALGVWAMAVLDPPGGTISSPTGPIAPAVELSVLTMPGVLLVALMALPRRGPIGLDPPRFAPTVFRRGAIVFGFAAVLLAGFLLDPGWSPFGTRERWAAGGSGRERNLSDLVWTRLIGVDLPGLWIVRELPGLVLVSAYYLALPILIARSTPDELDGGAGRPREIVWTTLLLFLASLPIKILLRSAFHVRDLVSLPEIFFHA